MPALAARRVARVGALWLARVSHRRSMSVGRKSQNPQQPWTATGTDLGLQVPSYIVWGAGTDVGKTLVSCGICHVASLKNLNGDGEVLYYKPVQTGFPRDSDADQVASVCGDSVQYELGDHAAALTTEDVAEFPKLMKDLKPHGPVVCRTEFAWSDPVSPHLAVEQLGRPVSDLDLQEAVHKRLKAFHDAASSKQGSLALVETAGAVLSPAPSGRVQADVLRGMRLPGILVGDGRIGGISSTLCALESLLIRGFDVSIIVIMDMGLKNDEAVEKIVSSGFYGQGKKPPAVFVLPPIPKRSATTVSEVTLRSWFTQSDHKFARIVQVLHDEHRSRLQGLRSMKEQARSVIWWPFTQHSNLSPSEISVIDSRCGDHWSVYADGGGSGGRGEGMHQMLDGSGSWWTSGMSPKTHPIVSRAVGYAAGRYGHVLFPQNVHEPALDLAKLLVDGPGKGWADRVFFSDNGSTAVEVGIKMGFHKYMMDHGLLSRTEEELEKEKFLVLALDGSYHGDTLGAMNAQSPSVFTGKKQFAWYRPFGHFMQPPTLALAKGSWKLELPEWAGAEEGKWGTREEAFDVHARKGTPLADAYRRHIKESIDAAEAGGARVGTLLMECGFHGAGGMFIIDPLFQHLLAAECSSRKIPVVMDEIFSGIWRLGSPSGCRLADIKPDVACYGKLLTGGTVPLAATLATETVYSSFLGDTKAESLLHGHSYTAHAIGCQAGVAALKSYTEPSLNPNYTGSDQLAEQWDPMQLVQISKLSKVKSVRSIGTVCAIELDGGDGLHGEGYEAKGALEVMRKLSEKGISGRPLGNVAYFMASPLTSKEECKRLLDSVLEVLA